MEILHQYKNTDLIGKHLLLNLLLAFSLLKEIFAMETAYHFIPYLNLYKKKIL